MKDTHGGWKTLSSKISHQNPWFSISEEDVHRPDGTQCKYYVINYHFPGVSIVPINEKNEVYLVGIHRYPTDIFSWEIPAGGAEGNDPLAGAKRELKEELGILAKNWQEVGSLQAMNGGCSQMKYVFVAQGLTQLKKNEQREEAIAKSKKVTFNQVLEMVKNHEITDAHSVSALMLAGLHLKLI